jgi:hypothetical protein
MLNHFVSSTIGSWLAVSHRAGPWSYSITTGASSVAASVILTTSAAGASVRDADGDCGST